MKKLALYIILFIVLILIAIPSSSQEHYGSRIYWPGPDFGGVTSVEIVPERTHFATVIIENRISYMTTSRTRFSFVLDGYTFEFEFFAQDGMLPDIITVILPIGFSAYPSTTITVEENETGFIEIHQLQFSSDSVYSPSIFF